MSILTDYEYLFFLSILASRGVGKKTLRTIGLHKLPINTAQIYGVDFLSKAIEIDGKKIKLQIWLFYYEEQNILDKKFFIIKKAAENHGVILLYDITNIKSLNTLSEWCQRLKIYLKRDIPFLLVGNKLDLEENRKVSKEEVEKFKEKHDISESIEISLQTGENVEKMLMTFIGMIEGKTIDKRDFSIFICPKCKAKMEKLTHFCGK